ncbi:MAG: DUF4249 domain-containing protein [Bacteroidota bacterium]
MNKTKLLSVLLLFVVASCTERIDVKLDESYTRLIIDGSITTDLAPSVVTLTKSSGYFSNAPSPKVTGATVTLFDGTTLYQLTETVPGKSGMYSSRDPLPGKAGKEYTLHVEMPEAISGHTSYEAACILNPVASIDSVTVTFHPDWGNNGIWSINLYAQEPGNQENFYLFNWFRNGVPMSDSIQEKIVMDDKFISGKYIAGLNIFDIDNTHKWETLKPGDTITLQMSGITKGYLNFISQVQQAGFNIPFFTGPPANVQGNVGSGGSGYFAAYSNSYATTIVR